MNLLKPSTWFAQEQKHAGGSGGLISEIRDALLGASNTAAGVPVNYDNAMRSTTVMACVRVLAESVASLPLHVYRELPSGEQVRAITNGKQDRIYTVLNSRPNSYQTKFQFMELVMQCLLLRGNFYGQIIRNGEGRLQEIIPIHPDRVVCHRRDDLTFEYEIQISAGNSTFLARDQILHISGMGDGVCGYSLISWAKQAIGYALAAEEHGARMFSNGARVGGVLKHQGKLSAEAAERLQNSFSQAQSGIANAHKTLVLEEGMEWSPIGMSNSDAQYLDLRKYQRTEICSIFRVPPHMVQDLERATFSNIEHQSLQFVRDSLRPWLVRIEQAMMRDLLKEDEKSFYRIEHNVEGLLRGDTSARYAAYTQALQWGWMSINDVRGKEGLSRIQGGDAYYRPLNMTPIDAPLPAQDQKKEALDEAIDRALSNAVR